MAIKSAIQINRANFGYARGQTFFEVLSQVELTCNAGELYALVGLNGSGKSTLLRSIGGLQQVVTGDIFISGIDHNRMSRQEKSRQMAVVFTERISGFNLSCRDLVSSGRFPYTNIFHQLSLEDKSIVEKCMKMTGVGDHSEKYLSELSDGMYRKAAIAKALAQQTGILLLDEPGAFLDYASKHELFILLNKLCKEEGKCILLSTHELDLVLKYCDKVLLLSNARLKLLSVGEAVNDPDFKKISGGFL